MPATGAPGPPDLDAQQRDRGSEHGAPDRARRQALEDVDAGGSIARRRLAMRAGQQVCSTGNGWSEAHARGNYISKTNPTYSVASPRPSRSDPDHLRSLFNGGKAHPDEQAGSRGSEQVVVTCHSVWKIRPVVALLEASGSLLEDAKMHDLVTSTPKRSCRVGVLLSWQHPLRDRRAFIREVQFPPITLSGEAPRSVRPSTMRGTA